MASKAATSPTIHHVMKRCYAQAAAVPKGSRLRCGITDNKIIVAGLNNGSPVTRITVAFKAGSRYEPLSDLGLSHALRSAAGLTTTNASAFITARKIAQCGASFTASSDRELIYYTIEATQDNLGKAMECINNLISRQEFRPWEVADNLPRMKYDLAALTPQVRAVDLLHRAAFRRGLGNSIFMSPKKISSLSAESLQHFACANLIPTRCAVAVVGEDMAKAEALAYALQLSNATDHQNEPSVYYGGEARKEMGGDLTHVALAVQGANAGSQEALALAVAARALGNGPAIKWGNDNSFLAKTIGNIGPFAAAGFNVSYSDNGLFGVVLTVPKDEAFCAVKNVVGMLKKLELSRAAIELGKNQLKTQIFSDAEQGTSTAEALAAQCIYTQHVRSATDLAADIDKLTDAAIQKAVQTACQSKLSIGAAGNLAFVPYADEL